MTKKELTTLIRHVVREEVEYAIKKEIILLKEEIKGNQPALKPTQPYISERTQPQATNYTNNSALNNLLNETALSFTSRDAQAFGAMRKSGQPLVSLSEPFQPIGGTITDPIMPAVDPRDPVAQFINKDYRAVMAAIDEKKNHRP
jgi:hypothetical protein